MASYRGHVTFASALGAAYGSAAVWYGNMDWGPAFLAAGLTTLGGLAPDLDSDSGVPVRELFGLAAGFVPLLLLHRLEALSLSRGSTERTLVLMALVYLLVRYGGSALFKHLTVHRGMFHSVPALLIGGLLVFLCYHSPSPLLRLFLAGAMMLGFLSHLVLDELCSVDLAGVTVKLNKYAGSALKLFSPSWPANLVAYLLLAGLLYQAGLDVGLVKNDWRTLQSKAVAWFQGPRRPS
jgi:hypothetical protein